MAAAFVAMNDTYGPLYAVSRAEAATPEMADERAKALKNQFIMDMHTHFLRDDTRIKTFVAQRATVGQLGWNPALSEKEQTIDDLKFANYFKEIFLDSDTKVACISGSPSDEPQDWFLTNEMKYDARAKVNKEAGTKRMFSHAIFTPGWPGWLEQGRGRLREAQARFVEGLHDRRQHQQAPVEVPVPARRREAHVSVLRAAREVEQDEPGHRQRLHPQGALPAVGREAVPAPARVFRRARRGQGREGLAAAELHHLPLGLALDRAGRARSTRGSISRRPAASNGSPTSPRSRRSTA